MSPFEPPLSVVGVGIAVVAVVVLGVALFLLERERRRARSDERLVALAREMRHRYEALRSVTRDGILVESLDGRVLDISERAAQILGVEVARTIGRAVGDLPLVLVTEQGLSMNPMAVLGMRTAAGDAPLVVGVVEEEGPGAATRRVRMVQVASRLVPEGDGESAAVLTTLVDVTGRREVEQALTRSEQQFRVAMDNAPIGMALADLSWTITEANAALAELLGTQQSALRGYPLDELSAPEDRAAERLAVDSLLGGGHHRFSLEKRLRRADGHLVWVVMDTALVRAADGQPDHFVVQVRDTTESKLKAEMLTHRASHDPLTGLANRSLLQEVLQAVLEQPAATERVAVLAVDLDGFKKINDRYGHATGDDVLVHVAGVLRAASARRGTVARLGGDEFVVVAQDDDAAKAAFEIAAAVHVALREPVRIARQRLGVGASIGIATADPDLLEGGAPAMLAAADAALYRAKAGGRGRTEVYDASMASASATGLVRELAAAVAGEQIVVHYQPIVDLADSQLVGYEALLRWEHPRRGLLLPGAFLPYVEEAGVLAPIGDLVVARVVDFLASTSADGRWVSVNVSAEQLGDGEFATHLLSEISRRRLTAGRLVLELTEASLVAAGTRIRHELTQLAAAGVPVLLDDFGTGISPLSYLRDLPVAGVKLDMSFTSGIPTDPAAGRVARALGALAREMSMVTIAEGIEREEQARFLHDNGWRYGQGWLFGSAQPPQD